MASQTGRDTANAAQTGSAYGHHASRTPLWIGAAALAAVIAAQKGEYEIGRQHASVFFTGLQRRVLPGTPSDAAAAARQILAQRDAIITALARNDPASASVLAQTLARYREVVRQAGLDSVVAPQPGR